jgi:hypothetical protein
MTEKEYRQSFGCCADLPEMLLHTGDYWDYPRWYIKYIRGEGNKKLPGNVQKLLMYLIDETWKVKTGLTGIGVGSQEATIELELIQMSPVIKPYKIFVAKSDYGAITDIGDSREFEEDFRNTGNGFIGAFKITERGKIALSQNALP